MSDHFCTLQGFDVLQEAVPDAVHEISLDGGASFRTIVGKERTDGVKLREDQKFVARVSKAGLFTVTQPLVVQGGNHLAFDGEPDFGARPVFSHSTSPVVQWRHVLHTSLTLLRDATPDRKAHGCADLPSYAHNMLSFGGAAVLASGGWGWARFAGGLAPEVPSLPSGKLLFFKTVVGAKLPGGAKRVPELTAVYVPSSVDLAKPLPMHVFFSPFTHPKKGDYPYSTDFNAMIDNYLVSGGKRLVNQINAAKKKCILVFPVAPREEHFAGVLPAAQLRRFLLEVACCVRRTAGGETFQFERPTLGLCSASAFSSGAEPLIALMQSSMANEFPELREIYSLDGFPGGSTKAFGGMAATATAWWGNGAKGRRLRMYSHYGEGAGPAELPAFAKTPTSRNGDAFATELEKATYVHAPTTFWQRLFDEQADTSSPLSGYFWAWALDRDKTKDGDRVHQLMPSVFLEHAFRNSAYEDA